MVMLPEVWGWALDPLMVEDTNLIILTPAGKRFDQHMAVTFSKASHLVFGCGRYEGIDDRVRQHYSTDVYSSRNIRVHEVSIGDYVLGGGEVASLVMIEAITRLLPGVLGNPLSLSEESHNEDGYLEYPNFTKPSIWRDIPVPEILLSGNHGEIAKWRAEQARKRAEKNI
jgi:tRNA (guanine37-N1)-methyltransferase